MSALQPPLDDHLGQEAQEAHPQPQKQHEGAKATRLGLSCQLPNDEQHVEDESPHAIGEEEARNLRLGKTKNHDDTPLRCPVATAASRSGRLDASTRSR